MSDIIAAEGGAFAGCGKFAEEIQRRFRVAVAEYTTMLPVEGTYTLTASAVGPDGQTYSDTVTITLVSKTQMDSLLKAKWEGMKAAFTLKDVQKTASFFVAEYNAQYSGIFTALGNTLPQVARDIQNVNIIYVMDSIAQFRIKRTEAAGLMSYYIYFVKDANYGIWRI